MNRLGRIISAITAVFFATAVLIVVFGTLFPASIEAVIVQIETAIPTGLGVTLTGLLLVGVGVYLFREGSETLQRPSPLVNPEQQPEESRQPPGLIGADFDAAVDEAARDVRVKQVPATETEPYQRLKTTVSDIASQRQSSLATNDVEVIQSGEWTADTVAQAFLSDDIEYPLTFRLLRWARPEIAFRRAVSRTSEAIQIYAKAELSNYNPGIETTDVSSTHRAVDSLRELLSSSKRSGVSYPWSGSGDKLSRSGNTETAEESHSSTESAVASEGQLSETSTEGPRNV